MKDQMAVWDALGDGLEAVFETPGLKWLVGPVRQERTERVSKVLGVAEKLSGGLPRQNLAIWVQERPGTMNLMVRVLLAAGRSGNDETLKILGFLLHEGLQHPERADEQEVIVAALEGLTASQLAVLVAVHSGASEYETVVLRAIDLDVSKPMIQPILIGLFTRGLLQSPYGYGGVETWQVSAFGAAVIEAAEQVRELT